MSDLEKINSIFNAKIDSVKTKDELQNLKTYREKRDTVRDNVVNIIHRAKEKYPDMNQQQAAELDADIQAYIRSMGLSQKDFTTITPSTLLNEDEFGIHQHQTLIPLLRLDKKWLQVQLVC